MRYFLSLRGDSRSNLTSLNAQHGWLPRSPNGLARNDPPPAPSAREEEMEAGFSRTHCIIASEHNVRARLNPCAKLESLRILCRLIASLRSQ